MKINKKKKESIEIGDYTAVFSIASALSNASICRLKNTWAVRFSFDKNIKYKIKYKI